MGERRRDPAEKSTAVFEALSISVTLWWGVHDLDNKKFVVQNGKPCCVRMPKWCNGDIRWTKWWRFAYVLRITKLEKRTFSCEKHAKNSFRNDPLLNCFTVPQNPNQTVLSATHRLLLSLLSSRCTPLHCCCCPLKKLPSCSSCIEQSWRCRNGSWLYWCASLWP